MQVVAKSNYPQFILSFRDYLRAQHQLELELREEMHGDEPTLAAYFDENAPEFPLVKQEAERFLRDPFNEKYQNASWIQGGSEISREHNTHFFNANVFNTSTVNGIFAQWKQQKFTLFITALCAFIYLLQLLGFEEDIMIFASFPYYDYEFGQPWRYFSHSFVHLSPWHILTNLAFWWLFGGAIERQLGIGKLISIAVIASVLTGIAQYLASGPLFFGLSGVVYATVGFVYAADKWGKTPTYSVLPKGFLSAMIVGIAFGFISPLIGIEMGNAAHISGFLIGLALGALQGKLNGTKVRIGF